MQYCATGNVDQTFCPKLLSTKWTFDIFFLISVTSNHSSHIKYVHICKDCNSKFVEMHVDASDIYPSALVFYTRHRVNITIYRTVYLHTDMCLQTLTHIQLKNKLWTTVAFLHCCNLIWGLANNNYSLYFLQFLTISGNLRLCYIFISYCTVHLYIVEPLSKLTETSFFYWRLHKYELLQFVWYWITTQ
jgi:hypothetical protein